MLTHQLFASCRPVDASKCGDGDFRASTCGNRAPRLQFRWLLHWWRLSGDSPAVVLTFRRELFFSPALGITRCNTPKAGPGQNNIIPISLVLYSRNYLLLECRRSSIIQNGLQYNCIFPVHPFVGLRLTNHLKIEPNRFILHFQTLPSKTPPYSRPRSNVVAPAQCFLLQ
jgi:hypothetical protein